MVHFIFNLFYQIHFDTTVNPNFDTSANMKKKGRKPLHQIPFLEQWRFGSRQILKFPRLGYDTFSTH